MDQVTFPIRVFKLLGVDTIVCEYYSANRMTSYKRIIRDWQ